MQRFYTDIYQNALTPAEIQGFLLVHRDDPHEAIKMAQSFAEATIAAKRTGSNVAHFSGQVGVADADREGQRQAPGGKKVANSHEVRDGLTSDKIVIARSPLSGVVVSQAVKGLEGKLNLAARFGSR